MCVCAHSYVERYGLKDPSDNIEHVLKGIAVKLGKTQRVKAITGVGKEKYVRSCYNKVLLPEKHLQMPF